MRLMKKLTFGKVTQLIFMPKLFPMNCYLVDEEDGITLVDACMPFVAKAIETAIQATGKPLTRILLTHAHADHIGAVSYLKEKYPDVKIGISRRDSALLKGELHLLPNEAQTPIKGGVPKKQPFAPDFVFDDNERIGSLTAIATPGHTPGHFAFLESENGNLIVGDAFQSKGGFAISGTMKWKFPFPAMATWHARTAIASAEKIAALNPSVLLVGHGPAIVRPAEAIQRALNEARQYADRKKNG
ncbi:MBL fold metallo-hydrolase [Cohnella endophytica]|uniref:MBL fold metallo-hydrolase n=1 Tax=Cohnella endophytica TaxID=2419778 RepID=A0A494XXA4_9BACL|nr:MBL fold metallo-hydrolase [Cohnella endophytica]RKP55122.1 MBL fold metallo-hydrolase [Cohnella endophytica]